MIDRSIRLLQDAETKARTLKARAYKMAPWLVGDAVAERRPSEDRTRDGGRT